MNPNKNTLFIHQLAKLRLIAFYLTLLLPITIAPAHATTDLSQVPLNSINSVPPNILFINDDSDSMDYETMTNDGACDGRLCVDDPTGYDYSAVGTTLDQSIIHASGCSFTTSPPARYAFVLEASGAAACSTATEEEWRVRFSELNHIYYNPDVDYAPWPNYPSMTLESAWIDPTLGNVTGNIINLTTDSGVLVASATSPVTYSRSYYSTSAWQSWCTTYAPATTCKGWRYYYRDSSNNKIRLKWVADLSSTKPAGRPYSPRENFANWFTYHRSRQNVAKYAIGSTVINSSGKRLGYAAINDILNGTTSDIAYISNNNSANVLSKLYNTFHNGETPLQNALDWAGRYYEIGETGDAGNSPILSNAQGGSCQLNNTILMTDGFYTTTDNFASSSNAVGDADGDNNTSFDGPPYAGSASNTLGDIAMHYYERDLANFIDNKVPTSAVDKNSAQHMNTYTISIGLKGTITNTDSLDFSTLTSYSWPTPNTFTPATKIDDLFHASVNGRGHYFLAIKPEELISALDNIVSGIPISSDSTNTVSASSFQLDQSQTVITTSFDTTHWSGSVKAFKPNSSGVIDTTDPSTMVWSSDTTLPFGSSRQIITYDGSAGIPFEWSNIQGTGLESLLSSNSTTAQARLDYLRGKNDSNFRYRVTPLGDIVNSTPVYVGTPILLYPESDPFGVSGDRYSNFWTNNKNRTPVVYVGANDGMLHAFKVSDGTELLAYAPRSVFSRLKDLTKTAFDTSHEYYVDQTPAISDVYMKTPLTNTAAWRTVLVSGLGAGGEGLFALDITNPTNFSESNADKIALWEFSNANDSDLGYTLAKPVIAMTEDNRWVAIVGNGYSSGTGKASLFILDLSADASDGWSLDSDPTNGWDSSKEYIKLPAGSDTGNALFSTAAVDSDGNGKVDRVYAGDLKGNLWVFDLKNYTSEKLFTAQDSSGNPQPITSKPTVVRHPTQPTTSNYPNMLVMFGTGRYLSNNDLTTTASQSFYAVWDDGNQRNMTRSSLAAQSLTTGTDSTLNIDARLTQNIDVKYSATDSTKQYGWYLDLFSNGTSPSERVITSATYYQGIVFFTTYIPSSNPCENGGDSWFMTLKAYNGGPPDQPIISINHNRLIEDNVDVVNLDGSNKAPSGLKITGGAFGVKLTQESVLINTVDKGQGVSDIAHNLGGPGNQAKRISWRELRRQ